MKSLYIFLMWHTKAHKPYLGGQRSCLSKQSWMQEANFPRRIVNETHPRDHIMKNLERIRILVSIMSCLLHIVSSNFCISINLVHCNYPIIRNKVPNILFLSAFLLLQPDVWIHLRNIFFKFSFFHTELVLIRLLTLTSLAVMLTRLGALHS